MSLLTHQSQSESALRKEARIFRQQFGRLINSALNRLFELTEHGARRRLNMIILLSILFGLLIIFLPLMEWVTQYNSIVGDFSLEAFMRFLLFLGDNLFGPETPRIFSLILLSFAISLEAAARYLDDIFELNQVDIARRFIWQVALTGNRKHIRIREGQINPEDLDSPIFKIGGPGQVEVELDSAALFEKPDGRPNVIGPTVKGKATLQGFERLRQAIDLRDQYPNPLEVASRSLDGIPVSTVDIRVLYSIWRKNQPPSIEHPYPFDSECVKTLIYSQASRVNIHGLNPSDVEETWGGTIASLIGGELGKFMSEHSLVEYLASVGAPELQFAQQREREIQKAKEAVIPEDDSGETKPEPELPQFQPRHKISNLFSQFTLEFTEKASDRGVELHWVGVGTWKTPSEIVPEKHLEAWRLSCENLTRSNPVALKKLQEEARIQQIIRLVQNVPLSLFKASSNEEHRHIAKGILIAYRQQLLEAVTLLEKSKKPVPGSIRQAIQYIGDALGHWLY